MLSSELSQTCTKRAFQVNISLLDPRSYTLRTSKAQRHCFAMQGLFSLVFGLSVNLLELVLFEILGVLGPK